MRQRNVKNLDRIISDCSAWKVEEPKAKKGQWRSQFANSSAPLYLELGSGKGQFITQLALRYPERNYIACEAQDNVSVRILQKAKELELANLLVICEHIENTPEYFEDDELSGLYLNFSDPWPKNCHEKRRLTFGKKLLQYRQVLENGSFIQFKTDNDNLFEYSLTQFDECGFEYVFTRDLYRSEYAEGNIPTEYEEKFASAGKSINFARLNVLK